MAPRVVAKAQQRAATVVSGDFGDMAASALMGALVVFVAGLLVGALTGRAG
jgi:hypothetical protein